MPENSFEKALVTKLGEKRLEKIEKVKIGIAGAGGIGSNCAQYLARCGFKHFLIVDFDLVETSNLNRQFYFLNQVGKPKVEALKENLLAINPDIKSEILCIKITQANVSKLFRDCEIIVEAFDCPQAKKMLVEEYLSSQKLLIGVSGIAGWGNSNQIKVHKIKEKFYVVGDLSSESTEETPPLAPGVNIAAAKQADVILNYVLQMS